ncbi:hypothetical protein FPV67DRAFT_1661572 [Lyophyllum atratum]|nr:hypothetical protein FPV67DRAFT_1661572 [Lyophyllum atratum]
MSGHIPDEHIEHGAHPVVSSPVSSNTLVDLTRLIQHQNQVMQDMAETSTRGMRDLLAVLRKMDDRQAAATAYSMQPIRPVAATSSSAWSPLLRSHLENIQPRVDRWRGTLDTLLVFVALFSAVVTAFFIQSLTGLSENTGKRTNELLANLTDIIIMLRGADATVLDFTPAIPFKPEASDVRLNVYWSVSLILSVSIASLAVTIRGYVSMITRSRYTYAHEKLTELHLRWKKTKNLLGPAVEALPQLLIPPVILFVVGLLDTLMSLSFPTSIPFLPILAAAIISCVFAVAVGMYTLYTVIHGCIDRSQSPFQSTLSSWLSSLALPDRNLNNPATYHEAFHSAIQGTHDDDVLDQAVAAVDSLIAERRRAPSAREPPKPVEVSRKEMETFTHLLSSEVSVRANHAVAAGISRSLVSYTTSDSQPNSDVQIQGYLYKPEDRIDLLNLLNAAAGRQPIARWSSHFTTAMALLLCCETSGSWSTQSTPSRFPRLSESAPVLALLLTPFEDVCLGLTEKRLWWAVGSPIVYYAYEVLLSELKESHPTLGHSNDINFLNTAMEELMLSQSERTLGDVRVILQLWLAVSADTHTPLLLRIRYRGESPNKVPLHEALAHWIINPRMSKLTPTEIMRGVQQVVTFSKDRQLINGLEELRWILFLCEEFFASLFHDSFEDKSQLYPGLLEICKNLVFIALNTYGQYTHLVDGRMCFCSVSCQCRPLIIKLLSEILHNAPDVRLDHRTWLQLSSGLKQGFSHQDETADPSWSTIEHRHQVKQDIFAKLQLLAPIS